MKLKKLSALLLSMVTAIGLAGCGDKGTSSVPAGVSSAANVVSSVTQNDSKPAGSAESAEPTQSSAENETSHPTASAKGSFSVDGTKLLDANGNEFVMRGINHAHVWYRDKLDAALDGIAKTGANCVRIVLADGDQWTRIPADELETVIQKCIDCKMIMIAEVHDATGKDDLAPVETAADYWIEVKDVLNAHTDTVIVNIANEWIGKWDNKTWEKGYTTVIPKMREAGIKNTIMVDSAGWGQFGDSIKKSGKAVFDSDPDKNTMFSVHMYGSAGKNKKTIESNIKGATDQGLCIVVGEFGYNHSDGDVDEAYIMQYCTENGIGYIGWSWKGNSGGVEYLDISTDWEGNNLSADWGEPLVNGDNGIKKTAKPCTVFD